MGCWHSHAAGQGGLQASVHHLQEPPRAPIQPRAASRARPCFDRLQQLLERDGFLEEGRGADSCGLKGLIMVDMATHHDHGHAQQARGGPFLEQGDTIGVRHPDIQQHQMGPGPASRGTGLCGCSASSTL